MSRQRRSASSAQSNSFTACFFTPRAPPHILVAVLGSDLDPFTYVSAHGISEGRRYMYTTCIALLRGKTSQSVKAFAVPRAVSAASPLPTRRWGPPPRGEPLGSLILPRHVAFRLRSSSQSQTFGEDREADVRSVRYHPIFQNGAHMVRGRVLCVAFSWSMLCQYWHSLPCTSCSWGSAVLLPHSRASPTAGRSACGQRLSAMYVDT